MHGSIESIDRLLPTIISATRYHANHPKNQTKTPHIMRDMVKFSRLLLGLPAVWMLAAAAAAADDVPAARGPGCATRCGDIDVPYPFGLDPQCAIHAGFQLNCTTVGRTTKLFHNNLEVIKLSVQDGKA